jgi:hypothetical protein
MIKNGLAVFWLALAASSAHADGDYFSPTDDRVRLSLGIMRVSSSTTVQVDSSTGTPGTVVDAENDLGLDGSDIEPDVQAMVRVGERHRLTFDFFTLDRSATRTLNGQPIVFGDVVLQTGAPVQSTLNLRTFGFAYGYSFWHSETLEFAATLGINDTDINSSVRVQTQTSHVFQNEDVAGPFPTLGLDGTWVVSKRFYFDARGQYLQVHLHELQGSLGMYELDALYRFRANVSFGLGYTAVKADLNSAKTDHGGFFDFDSKGPQIFLRVAF